MLNKETMKLVTHLIKDMTKAVINTSEGRCYEVLDNISHSNLSYNQCIQGLEFIVGHLVDNKSPRKTAIYTLALMCNLNEQDAKENIDEYNYMYNTVSEKEMERVLTYYREIKYIESLIMAFDIPSGQMYKEE